MVKDCGGVKLDHLVVFDCEVMACALQVRHLHEESSAERSSDVDVVISACELCAAARQVETVHDPGQLLPHVVSRHQRTVVNKVVIAPLVRLMVLLEGVVDIEQRQVISINVSKPHLGLVSCFLCLRRTDKALWD